MFVYNSSVFLFVLESTKKSIMINLYGCEL